MFFLHKFLVGIIIGCIMGLLLNKFLFFHLVTANWGDPWYFPTKSVIIIVITIVLATCLAIYGPAKRIRNMSIVETISAD